MMNKDEVKGTAEQAKGKIKQGLANLTGNEGLRREGRADEAAGEAREAAGTARRKVGETVENIGKKIKR